MKGLLLDSLTADLHKVSAKHASEPVRSIKKVPQKLAMFESYITSCFDSFNFRRDYTELPLHCFENFSFDEICKLKFSSMIMMHGSVQSAFNTKPNYEVVRKIESSMWRWGVGTGTWNEVVDIYNSIRNFSLGLSSEFELRLDYTTGYNPCGFSKFSRTFIDGVFAFLVYYRREHVMTISFSIMEGYRLLIQQVQLKRAKGNRFLYRLPKHQVEYTIDLFARSFPCFDLYLIDGMSLALKNLADYESGLERARTSLTHYKEHPPSEFNESYRKNLRERIELLTANYIHLKLDTPRLARLYATTGHYTRGEELVVNQLIHYKLQPRTQ